MIYFNKFLLLLIVFQLFNFPLSAAATKGEAQHELNLQEIILPSEIKDMPKSGGAIYYSSSVKNKILIPVNMWGEVKNSGLHFIPSDTTFVRGLSLAGGATSSAKLESIKLIRAIPGGGNREIVFDLSTGGDSFVHEFKFEPGDSVFIKKDTFYENRGYYTSLIGIVLTLVSTFVIINKVK